MCTVTLKIRLERQQLWKQTQLWNSLCATVSFLYTFNLYFCAVIPPLCSSPKRQIILSDNATWNIIQNAISVIPMNVFVTTVCLGLHLSCRGQESNQILFFLLTWGRERGVLTICTLHPDPQISICCRARAQSLAHNCGKSAQLSYLVNLHRSPRHSLSCLRGVWCLRGSTWSREYVSAVDRMRSR